MANKQSLISVYGIARFWSKVDKSGDCWVWRAGVDRKGYGKFSLGSSRLPGGGRCNSMVSAHRVSYIIAFGDIPSHDSPHGMCVLHRCDNPSCVRPSHLFIGTNEDNVHDMLAKGRHSTNPRRGQQHGCAILTELGAREVYVRASSGERQADIARDFGVSVPTVSAIKAGRLWPHLTPGRT